ncbi:MAG: winged helix-turn-helix transcriptional regulator [Candidatus Thermoplasmatota archaeon]|nr:winged helix-turn-helix transcriptional regulator [Candidatus Thermoplasmatota archaeon]
MTRADQKKLEDIADGFMDSFPAFFRRVTRGATHPSAKKFDPSRIVLKAVLAHGPLSMSMIGRHMEMSKPYMTALVDSLISEGLVERAPDPDDRRVVNVMITDAGREEMKGFTKSAREAVVKNLSSLDAKDISTLHEMVKNIKGIISKLDQEETRKRRTRKGA